MFGEERGTQGKLKGKSERVSHSSAWVKSAASQPIETTKNKKKKTNNKKTKKKKEQTHKKGE